jgi:oligoribonuclease
MSNSEDLTLSAEDSRLIWIDCEMTGLDIFHDELCEVSVVPTDFNMKVLDSGIDLVIKPSDESLAQMNDFVRHMHTSSGLVEEMKQGLALAEAQRQVIEYVTPFLPKTGKAHLAGNSVGSDKKFLDRFMPDLMAKLHYRVIDVSTLKELSRRWYPAVYNNKPEKHGGHRALADIIESIDELRYYREAFFAPTPGPDDRKSKDIAAQVESTSLLRSYEAEGAPVEDASTPEKIDY